MKDITIIGGGPAGLFALFYSGMRGPILSSISSQREALHAVTVDAIIHLEKNAEACSYKNCMRSLESNVVARNISDGFRKAVRCQEFFDRKVRKLNHP